jgi:uncharacterized membrane protein YobD (UPF0266 family)
MAKQKPETIIEWEAPEFRHYPKNVAWFLIFGIVVAVIIIYQIFQKDWFGAISILIIAFFFAAFALHKPKIVNIRISTEGLHINDTFIPYNQIKQFWVVNNDNHRTLNIETTAYLNHLLAIELHEQDADEVQEILQELLPENEESDETFVQRIAHRFRF